MDHNRFYYKLLKQVVSQGQKSRELTNDMTVNEIVKVYAFLKEPFYMTGAFQTGTIHFRNMQIRCFLFLLASFVAANRI